MAVNSIYYSRDEGGTCCCPDFGPAPAGPVLLLPQHRGSGGQDEASPGAGDVVSSTLP